MIAGLAACGTSSTPASNSGVPKSGTLEVWLMNGSAPVQLTGSGRGQSCNATPGQGVSSTGVWVQTFESEYPGWTVNIDCQVWANIGTKTTTALASSSPPDVLEMGNTLVAGFAASGGLAPLGSYQFPNQSTWLESLKEAGTYNSKLYGVPYYAGDRVVIYNTAMFAKAGITATPTSLAQLISDGQAIQSAESSTPNFCALWLAGQSWYQIFSWIYDNGGSIATSSGGKWTGQFESSADETALSNVKAMRDKISSCAPSDQHGTAWETAFLAKQTAMVIEPGWAYGVAQADAKTKGDTALAGDLGVFPIPGQSGPAPVFLGGSNLGVAEKSPNKAMAVKFIQMITNTQFMSDMATVGGVIPNSSSLFYLATSPQQQVAFQAAKKSWFTPSTPGETTVENDKVYEDLLGSIMTGQSSVDAAAKQADQLLDQYLNASTS
jgi:N,N'-diacetylchitobiose transport system substrate-binding protein